MALSLAPCRRPLLHRLWSSQFHSIPLDIQNEAGGEYGESVHLRWQVLLNTGLSPRPGIQTRVLSPHPRMVMAPAWLMLVALSITTGYGVSPVPSLHHSPHCAL